MKKIIKSTLAVAALAVAGYGAYTSNESEQMSELALANVEALASGEINGGYTRTTGRCPHPISYKQWVSCSSRGNEDCYPSDC